MPFSPVNKPDVGMGLRLNTRDEDDLPEIAIHSSLGTDRLFIGSAKAIENQKSLRELLGRAATPLSQDQYKALFASDGLMELVIDKIYDPRNLVGMKDLLTNPTDNVKKTIEDVCGNTPINQLDPYQLIELSLRLGSIVPYDKKLQDIVLTRILGLPLNQDDAYYESIAGVAKKHRHPYQNLSALSPDGAVCLEQTAVALTAFYSLKAMQEKPMQLNLEMFPYAGEEVIQNHIYIIVAAKGINEEGLNTAYLSVLDPTELHFGSDSDDTSCRVSSCVAFVSQHPEILGWKWEGRLNAIINEYLERFPKPHLFLGDEQRGIQALSDWVAILKMKRIRNNEGPPEIAAGAVLEVIERTPREKWVQVIQGLHLAPACFEVMGGISYNKNLFELMLGMGDDEFQSLSPYIIANFSKFVSRGYSAFNVDEEPNNRVLALMLVPKRVTALAARALARAPEKFPQSNVILTHIRDCIDLNYMQTDPNYSVSLEEFRQVYESTTTEG